MTADDMKVNAITNGTNSPFVMPESIAVKAKSESIITLNSRIIFSSPCKMIPNNRSTLLRRQLRVRIVLQE